MANTGTFIDVLAMELEGMPADEIMEMTGAIGDGEEPVGECDETGRKLYTLACRYAERAHVFSGQAQYGARTADRVIAAKNAQEMYRKADVVREVFWAHVKDAMDLWGPWGIGVRADWRIVKLPLRKQGAQVVEIDLLDFLRRLRGEEDAAN